MPARRSRRSATGGPRETARSARRRIRVRNRRAVASLYMQSGDRIAVRGELVGLGDGGPTLVRRGREEERTASGKERGTLSGTLLSGSVRPWPTKPSPARGTRPR